MATHTRRDVLKGGLAAAGLGLLGLPDWALPAPAQGETLVPFTDIPDRFPLSSAVDRRIIDVRTIDGPLTPADQFFTTQHYGHPVVDPSTFRLTVTGLVQRPLSISLGDLRGMPRVDLVAGFECSGNRRPLQGLIGNGRWTGVSLRRVLEQAGVRPEMRETVFFGADRGQEEVEFRTTKYAVEQQFGRSLPRDRALAAEPLLAYALNGAPLTVHQGAPLRLIVPGWYGVANVKWLSQIHAQAEPYLGKYQARWYRTLKGEMIGGEVKWTETAITRMRLKSFVARVTFDGRRHTVLGVALNDGTPLKAVELRIDNGSWVRATLDAATRGTYSWKLFTYTWDGATPGEHTLVSRAIDEAGQVQPTSEDLDTKKTFLEDNSQYPRTVLVS